MKVAVFGGRFDPIHNGHLAVAQEVLATHSAQEVWLSIENQHQWRPIVASSEDRKAMAELAIQEEYTVILSEANDIYSSAAPQNDKVLPLKVDMTPVELGGLTETISVMRKLKEKHPEHEFVFVCGSDQLPTFSKWSHWDQLLTEVHFLIVARKDFPLENVPENATIIQDPTYEPLEDSATRIREYLKQGKSITDLVPKAVEEYIAEHKLYV